MYMHKYFYEKKKNDHFKSIFYFQEIYNIPFNTNSFHVTSSKVY